MVTKQTVIAFTLLILQINDCISFTHTSDKLNAFKIQRSTALNFNIPTFGANENKDDSSDETPEEEKKIGISGLIQLITAGMGSPFLGDFEGVDEETGNFMFSLEANNLVDENGNSKQTQAPYFESGWVAEEDLEKESQGFKFPWQK